MKKGVSALVGWVLLILFGVALSMLMLQWTRGFVQKQGEDLENRADDMLCNDASISIESLCQNTQTLNMNITNTNNLEIYKLRLRLIDLYDSIEIKEKEVSLATGDTERLSLLKQGTIKQAKVTPIIRRDSKEIACEGRSLTFENILQC